MAIIVQPKNTQESIAYFEVIYKDGHTERVTAVPAAESMGKLSQVIIKPGESNMLYAGWTNLREPLLGGKASSVQFVYDASNSSAYRTLVTPSSEWQLLPIKTFESKLFSFPAAR